MKRKDELRARIDEMFERRKQQNTNGEKSTSTNPRVEEPKTPPRAKGAARLRKPPIDDNEDEEVFIDPEDPIFNLSPILPRQMPNFGPKIQPDQWQPGNVKRTVTFDKGHPKSATEDITESNLNHMERVAYKQFDDTKHHRETYAKMQREAEERAYADREKARQAELQRRKLQQDRHAMDNELSLKSLWAQGVQEMRQSDARLNEQLEANRQRMREETAKLERQKMQYEKEIMEQQALLKQQKLESKRQLEQIKLQAKEQRKREKARQAELKQKYEFDRLMAQAEADVRREDNLQTQQMARMEYQDRDNQRRHTKNVELGLVQMHNNDRNAQRKYDLIRAGLENADELATVYDRLRDNAQMRYFRGAAFKDARARNHIQHVNVDKEQRGILRERAVRDIFEEFDLGDPDLMNLSEPHISMPHRRYKHTGCGSYVHSYVITGVDEIKQHAITGRPRVIFTDGSSKALPAWRDGYALSIRVLRPYVYLINVFKQPVEMVNKHPGRCPFCCKDCNVQ